MSISLPYPDKPHPSAGSGGRSASSTGNTRASWFKAGIASAVVNGAFVWLLMQPQPDSPPDVVRTRMVTPQESAQPEPQTEQAVTSQPSQVSSTSASAAVAIETVVPKAGNEGQLMAPALSTSLPAISDTPIAFSPTVPAFKLDVTPPTPPAPAPSQPKVDASPAQMAVQTDAQLLNGSIFSSRFYPSQAKAKGITGVSVIEFDLDIYGRVTAMRLLSSTPPGVFDRAAMRAARRARFNPARVNGRPVAATRKVEVKWRLDK